MLLLFLFFVSRLISTGGYFSIAYLFGLWFLMQLLEFLAPIDDPDDSSNSEFDPEDEEVEDGGKKRGIQ